MAAVAAWGIIPCNSDLWEEDGRTNGRPPQIDYPGRASGQKFSAALMKLLLRSTALSLSLGAWVGGEIFFELHLTESVGPRFVPPQPKLFSASQNSL